MRAGLVLPFGESEGPARAFPPQASIHIPENLKGVHWPAPPGSTAKINNKYSHHSRRAGPGSPPWGVRGACVGFFPLREHSQDLMGSTRIIRGGRALVLPRGESEGLARAFPPQGAQSRFNKKHSHHSRRAGSGSPPWGVRGVCAGPFPLGP
jgi:hypothetical protein